MAEDYYNTLGLKIIVQRRNKKIVMVSLKYHPDRTKWKTKCFKNI